MKGMILVAVITAVFTIEFAAGDCPNQPPSLPSGSKWVAAANCPRGPTYNEGTAFHCHCWCHKGYICDPIAAPPATTVAPGGTCARPPPVPAGSKWVAAANCPSGPTYNEGTAFHCHCWCHKGYICDPKAAPPTTRAPITTRHPCANRQPPVPAGSKWVPNANCPVGPTYNDPGNGGQPYHCHCWCHKGYICDPRGTQSTTTPAGSTSAGTTAATTAGSTAATTAGSTASTTAGSTAATTAGSTAATTAASTAATTAASTAATTAGSTAATTAASTTVVTTAATTLITSTAVTPIG